MKWMKDAPKDSEGKSALEYSVFRLKELDVEMEWNEIKKLPIARETQKFVEELLVLCKQYSIPVYPLLLGQIDDKLLDN